MLGWDNALLKLPREGESSSTALSKSLSVVFVLRRFYESIKNWVLKAAFGVQTTAIHGSHDHSGPQSPGAQIPLPIVLRQSWPPRKPSSRAITAGHRSHHLPTLIPT